MTDHELAAELLAVVSPEGDRTIEGAMAAGEDVGAIIDLIERAVLRSVPVPQLLLDAVADFIDNPALAPDDIAEVREDLETLAPVALTVE